MSAGTLALGVLLFFLGVLVTGIVWASLRPDAVGRRLFRPREAVGLQGRQAHWLETRAPLDRPKADALDTDLSGLLVRPGQRALQAIVQREALVTAHTPEQALSDLRQRAPSDRARHFLDGRVRAAIRAHARTLYRGPDSLFLAWFYLVALVRWGHRHLYLDMLAAVVEEFR